MIEQLVEDYVDTLGDISRSTSHKSGTSMIVEPAFTRASILGEYTAIEPSQIFPKVEAREPRLSLSCQPLITLPAVEKALLPSSLIGEMELGEEVFYVSQIGLRVGMERGMTMHHATMFAFVMGWKFLFAIDLLLNLVRGYGVFHWTTDLLGIVAALLLMGEIYLIVKESKE